MSRIASADPGLRAGDPLPPMVLSCARKARAISGVVAVGLGDRLPDVDHAHRNDRTSTLRLQAFDPSAAISSATSRSGAVELTTGDAAYSLSNQSVH